MLAGLISTARLLVVLWHDSVQHKAFLNQPGWKSDTLKVRGSALFGLMCLSRGLCEYGLDTASGTQAKIGITHCSMGAPVYLEIDSVFMPDTSLNKTV